MAQTVTDGLIVTGPLINNGFTLGPDVPRAVNRYYQAGCGPGGITGVAATAPNAVDSVTAVPFMTQRGGTVDRLAFNVIGLGAAGQLSRAAIYDADPDTMYPNALQVDGGSFASDVAGVKEAQVNFRMLPGLLYWFCMNSGAAALGALTLTSIQAGEVYGILGTSTGFQIPDWGWRFALAFGAYPATFPGTPGTATRLQVNAVGAPIIAVRFSNVDIF